MTASADSTTTTRKPTRDWDAAYRAAGVLPYTVTLRKGNRTFAEPFWAFPALVDKSAESIARDFKAVVVSVVAA